jgi:hypothetical protein
VSGTTIYRTDISIKHPSHSPSRARDREQCGADSGPAVPSYTADVPSHVDYALAKRAALRDLRRGVVMQRDVCDAHPELIRAARNLAVPTDEECPVCEIPGLRHVRYAYGERLGPANGRAFVGDDELVKLNERHDEYRAYEVEVCVDCGWNFLVRSMLLGRKHAPAARRRAARS